MLQGAAGSGERSGARIAPEHFALLFAHCRAERFASGHHLFMQDDASDRIYGVVSGRIEISLFSVEGQKLVANIEQGQSLVGEIGAFDGGRRTATATCIGPCELYSLTRRQLFERIEQHPELARAMIELLCARLRWVSDEFGDQAFLDVEARLAKRLLFLSARLADGEGWVAISQAELADFLGITRESVNRVLNDWRGRNWIALRRGALRLLHAPALRRIAAAEDGLLA
ncbi:MAG: Crp/Fnr family transcriptional regulator [Methylobacterium mesophilicum]|nr:Crp/Fnr family transcriptional regulator [Methylobacterium mesophilicum]